MLQPNAAGEKVSFLLCISFFLFIHLFCKPSQCREDECDSLIIQQGVFLMGAEEAELSQTVWMYGRNKSAGVFIPIPRLQTWWRVAQSSDLQGDAQRSSLIARPDVPVPAGLGHYYVRDKLL